MKREFLIPWFYTLKRDMIRHDNSLMTSVIGCVSSLIKEYLWVAIYAGFLVDKSIPYIVTGVIVHLITFSLAYEIGYIFTDNIGIRNEKEATRNIIYPLPIPDRYTYVAMFIRILVLGFCLILIKPWMSLEVGLLYCLTILNYLIYGSLKEVYRIPLFTILRFLKGFVPYAFILLLLEEDRLMLVSLVILGTAMFFTIEYASRKLELKYINVHKIKYFWLKYLIIASIVVPFFVVSNISFESSYLLFMAYIISHIITAFMSFLRGSFIKELFSRMEIFKRIM